MFTHNLSTLDVKNLIIEAMELGTKKTLVEMGAISATISKQQAYKMYGRGTVDRWLREKLITRVKDGINSSSIRISRMEIETVAFTSNRISWFKHYVPPEM